MLCIKNKALIILSIIIIACSCGEEINKIDLIYGEWKVEEIKSTTVNEDSGFQTNKEYFLEFRIQNFGTRYNLDKEATNEIKWIYQEGDKDMFMLSTQLENSIGTHQLSFNSIFEVICIDKEKFLLEREYEYTSNDSIYNTIWNLNLTRQ